MEGNTTPIHTSQEEVGAWCEESSATRNGRVWRCCYPERTAILDDPQETIGSSSKPFCGLLVPVRRGVTCPTSSGCGTRSTLWNLSAEQERISQAIGETNLQHFEQELRSLYPRLEKIGLETPLLEPVGTGNQEYDGTWHDFHLTFLKALRRQIRDERFDLEQWNSDVTRENEKRQNWLQVSHLQNSASLASERLS